MKLRCVVAEAPTETTSAVTPLELLLRPAAAKALPPQNIHNVGYDRDDDNNDDGDNADGDAAVALRSVHSPLFMTYA